MKELPHRNSNLFYAVQAVQAVVSNHRDDNAI